MSDKITLKEIKEIIRENEIKPQQIFTLDELLVDPSVRLNLEKAAEEGKVSEASDRMKEKEDKKRQKERDDEAIKKQRIEDKKKKEDEEKHEEDDIDYHIPGSEPKKKGEEKKLDPDDKFIPDKEQPGEDDLIP